MGTTHVRTGFVTQTHTGDVTIEETIEEAGEMGFDFVELYMDGRTERTRLDENQLEVLLSDQSLDLLVHLPFVDLDLGSPRPAVRRASVEELRECIRTAANLGAEKAVLHASSHATPPEWDRETIRPIIVESVLDLDRFGAEYDVELCVENLPGSTFSIDDFDVLFEKTDASMTFDTGHARVDGYEADDMAQFLSDHFDRVSHVHVNDSRAALDEHVPTGSGTIDFSTAFEPLLNGAWDGTFSIEIYTFDFDYIRLAKRKLHSYL